MQKIVLAEYIRDITKGENDKEIILYGKKKKDTYRMRGEGGAGSSANPLYPTKEDQNNSKKQFIFF